MTTATITTAAARAEQVTKTYGSGDARVTALDGVDVTFAQGEFTALMGPSGSGKSTLLHCLAGLDVVTTGRILIGDTDLGTLSDRELTLLRRRRLGFIFQAFNLLPNLTALQNITLPAALAGTTVEQDWLDSVVETVGLRDRLTHRPSELSGGQQQRVAVARAIAQRPDVIYADEPTGNLDSRSSAEILHFLRAARDEHGQTIVLVTHDPVAASYADRAIFLTDGRIAGSVADPTPDSVLDHVKQWEANAR
jgi:putative ABC transport system ATP-binding protein